MGLVIRDHGIPFYQKAREVILREGKREMREWESEGAGSGVLDVVSSEPILLPKSDSNVGEREGEEEQKKRLGFGRRCAIPDHSNL
jgi:hypothetical protein